MRFTVIALLIAAASAIQLHGDDKFPHSQRDYWNREKTVRADAADAAAAKTKAAAAAKKAAADAKAAVAAKAALTKQSGAVWAGIAGSDPLQLPGDVKEADFKRSATKISDDTHTGEHWDGPKRGRIIREYRRAMDQCNISGTNKCSITALGKNYPDNQPAF